MKRPQYVFRPNLSDPQHRRVWALLQQVPPAKRKEFLVQSILAAEQTDRLEKSIFAQAVLHDSKKTHGKTHLIRLLKEQKPLKFFTVDKDRMHDFARAAKAHGLLFCPIRDKMDPDHIEIAILQDDASKANRIIEKLQLDVVDTGTAELVDAVQQNLENAAPNHEDTPTVDFPLGSENASPSEPFSDSSKSFANSPSPRADQLRAKGERPSVRMELQDITAYLRNRAEAPKDRMPKLPVKIRRKEKVM